MYIKYLNNIHNLKNYNSYIKSTGKSDNCILLMKEETNYMSLLFTNTKIRDIVLNEIWIKLQDHVSFFDIDDFVSICIDTDKYNV